MVLALSAVNVALIGCSLSEQPKGHSDALVTVSSVLGRGMKRVVVFGLVKNIQYLAEVGS